MNYCQGVVLIRLSCDLSPQSSALRLQQEVREGEGHLEQAYQQLAKGEAPDNEAAVTWTRMVAEENKRNQQLDRQVGTPQAA